MAKSDGNNFWLMTSGPLGPRAGLAAAISLKLRQNSGWSVDVQAAHCF